MKALPGNLAALGKCKPTPAHHSRDPRRPRRKRPKPPYVGWAEPHRRHPSTVAHAGGLVPRPDCCCFKLADSLYTALTDAQKLQWRLAVKKRNTSPYDFWMHEQVPRLLRGLDPLSAPPNSGGYGSGIHEGPTYHVDNPCVRSAYVRAFTVSKPTPDATYPGYRWFTLQMTILNDAGHVPTFDWQAAVYYAFRAWPAGYQCRTAFYGLHRSVRTFVSIPFKDIGYFVFTADGIPTQTGWFASNHPYRVHLPTSPGPQKPQLIH